MVKKAWDHLYRSMKELYLTKDNYYQYNKIVHLYLKVKFKCYSK